MNDLRKRIAELSSYCAHADAINTHVSAVNVSWHIQHSLLVLHKSIQALLLSKPEMYKPEFNLPRFILFYLKWFPRGKGKASERVQPKSTENIDYDALFEKAEQQLQRLEEALPNQCMPHPVFGILNTKQTITMLSLHTLHHIRIIKDILKH
ncbi:MAG: DUF1569 domain-containing protein [Ignavibacteria bacterium]